MWNFHKCSSIRILSLLIFLQNSFMYILTTPHPPIRITLTDGDADPVLVVLIREGNSYHFYPITKDGKRLPKNPNIEDPEPELGKIIEEEYAVVLKNQWPESYDDGEENILISAVTETNIDTPPELEPLKSPRSQEQSFNQTPSKQEDDSTFTSQMKEEEKSSKPKGHEKIATDYYLTWTVSEPVEGNISQNGSYHQNGSKHKVTPTLILKRVPQINTKAHSPEDYEVEAFLPNATEIQNEVGQWSSSGSNQRSLEKESEISHDDIPHDTPTIYIWAAQNHTSDSESNHDSRNGSSTENPNQSFKDKKSSKPQGRGFGKIHPDVNSIAISEETSVLPLTKPYSNNKSHQQKETQKSISPSVTRINQVPRKQLTFQIRKSQSRSFSHLPINRHTLTLNGKSSKEPVYEIVNIMSSKNIPKLFPDGTTFYKFPNQNSMSSYLNSIASSPNGERQARVIKISKKGKHYIIVLLLSNEDNASAPSKYPSSFKRPFLTKPSAEKVSQVKRHFLTKPKAVKVSQVRRPFLTKPRAEKVSQVKRPFLTKPKADKVSQVKRPFLTKPKAEKASQFNRPFLTKPKAEKASQLKRPFLTKPRAEKVSQASDRLNVNKIIPREIAPVNTSRAKAYPKDRMDDISCLSPEKLRVRRLSVEKMYKALDPCPVNYPCLNYNSCALWMSGLVGKELTINPQIFDNYMTRLFSDVNPNTVSLIKSTFTACVQDYDLTSPYTSSAKASCETRIQNFKDCVNVSQNKGICTSED